MINELFKQIDKSTFAANGDSVDKLVSFYTMLIYIIGAIFLSVSPFVAGAFHCFAPAYYKPGWVQYATRQCYLQNSYYIPFTTGQQEGQEGGVGDVVTIAEHVGSGEALEIHYYQWVPYYLAFSSVLFVLPYVYWTSVTKAAGVDLEYLVTKASQFDSGCSQESRHKTIRSLADYIDVYLDNQEPVPGRRGFVEKMVDMFKCCSNPKGNLMSNNYLLCKLLYLAVIGLQLFSLCKFLGMNLVFYAFDPNTMGDLLLTHSFDWRPKELFPLVTFCNFTKQLQIDKWERRFIQCAMPNNIFNERFFVLLAYWLLALFALVLLSGLSWFNSLFLGLRRDVYVKRLIRVTQPFPRGDTCPATDATTLDEEQGGARGSGASSGAASSGGASSLEKERLRDFVSWYLQEDGLFVFRMIETNTSQVVASEIMCQLWEHFNANYEEEKKHRRQRSSRPSPRPRHDHDEEEEEEEEEEVSLEEAQSMDKVGTSSA